MAFIKICGMTDARAVQAALAAGVDAIGFVFAPSVRQVTPEQASVLAQPARGKALCVAVTLHPDAALLQQIFTQFQPDVLQTDVDDLAGITLPSDVKSWPVLRAVPLPAPPDAVPMGGPATSGNGAAAAASASGTAAASASTAAAGNADADCCSSVAATPALAAIARASWFLPSPAAGTATGAGVAIITGSATGILVASASAAASAASALPSAS